MTISQLWRAFGLPPHWIETFKLSADALWIRKARDIVGLYLNPAERAGVLCVDEKTQSLALDRTVSLLSLRLGQAERRTHDYKHSGTTSLLAAVDAQTETVIAETGRRHRSAEVRTFLDRIDAAVAGPLEVHIVLDNDCTHQPRSSERGWPDTRGSTYPLHRRAARG